jgi:hypothetical protein
VASEQGRVAFGSDSFDLFDRLRRSGAVGVLPVYVVASRTGSERAGGGRSPDVGRVHLRGVLAAVTDADRRGRHPDLTIRPGSALATDGGWALFWELGEVEELKPSLALAQFATRSGQPWLRVPEGPVEAKHEAKNEAQ